jgi:hypothetical protein
MILALELRAAGASVATKAADPCSCGEGKGKKEKESNTLGSDSVAC